MRPFAPILRGAQPSPRHRVAGIVKKVFYQSDYSESGPRITTTVCRGVPFIWTS